ncbi:MAG: sigma-70 family RNA polymerase sigma factor [Bacteroidia bacterium]|nr:sigma-70 family RNA polymerase sigma factor [Bacteroidia bacterium]
MEQGELSACIKACLQQDVQAFARLVTHYQNMVYRLAFRLLSDDDEARDMVQETFVKVWLSLDRYEPTYKFSTWLYKITCHVCYDRLRVLYRSPSFLSSENVYAEIDFVSEEDVEQALVNREAKERILRLVDELSPKQKLVFVLREIEEMSVSEVTYITKLSANQIKYNLYWAKKNIQEKLMCDETIG